MSEVRSTYLAVPALIVGLDPSEETGVAVCDPKAERLKYVMSQSFWVVVSLFETELGPETPSDGSTWSGGTGGDRRCACSADIRSSRQGTWGEAG